MADAARTDLAAIEAMGAVLEGSDGPLVIASGVVGLADGRVATEADQPASGPIPASPAPTRRVRSRRAACDR